MIADIKKDAEQRMGKAVAAFSTLTCTSLQIKWSDLFRSMAPGNRPASSRI